MSQRKGETKRQHYVPRMILRNFSKDGRRVSLLIHGRRIDGASLRDQCYEDYFYGADNVIEKSFAAEEGKVAVFLGDLSPERFTTLDPERVHQLRMFVTYQHGRTPGAAEHLSNFEGAFAKAMLREKIARDKDTSLRPEDIDRVQIRTTNAQHEAIWLTTKLTPILLDMQVKFIATDRTPGFVVADHPVVAYNQFAEHHPVLHHYPTRTGLTAKGLQLFLPLSPGMMLALFDPTTYEYGGKGCVCRAGPSDVAFLNEMQAINALTCIYFNGDRATEASLAALTEARARHRSIYEKQSTMGTMVEPDGKVRQFLFVHHAEIQIGAKLSFIRTIDGHPYETYAGPSVPVRSPELVQLAEDYGRFLEAKVEEGKRNSIETSPSGDVAGEGEPGATPVENVEGA